MTSDADTGELARPDGPECWTCGQPCGHVYATPIERPDTGELARLREAVIDHAQTVHGCDHEWVAALTVQHTEEER